uniref:Uncharacterized protein n=1 Tax=Leptolyngbya boryana TaxID=1184 RepID=Q9AM06_LEPBY|nr:hypothetical protein [Leptolyngbya boryana]
MFRNQHSDVLDRAFGYCSLKSVGGIGEWGNGEVFSLFPQIARSYTSNRIDRSISLEIHEPSFWSKRYLPRIGFDRRTNASAVTARTSTIP